MSHASKPTAILLNPPAEDIAIRDNYCSKISQAAYINHPVDLLVQSGYLTQSFDLLLIDAVIEKMTSSECLHRISQFNPAAVFCLVGNATWPDDRIFLQDLRRLLPGSKIVCSGDIFIESPVEFLASLPFIDGILTDYTSPGLFLFLTASGTTCDDMVFRDDSGTILDHRHARATSGIMSFPTPRHELFLDLDYRYPFVRSRRFATVITEFGCPFHCSFCVMGTLGCKRRSLDEVSIELETLVRSGIRDIFFLDQSFGSDPARNIAICKMILRHFPDLRWLCFSRVDLVDQATLALMKKAGCHTIIFGVESANATILERYRKGYSPVDVDRVLRLAKNAGIRTVATFLLGLPGETWSTAIETIEFAAKLPCTYVSLNVAVPRMGTEMRKLALEHGYVDPEIRHFDQSGTEVVLNTETLTGEQLIALKRIAVKRLYLQPRRIAKVLSSIRTFDELIIHLREAFGLVSRLTKRKNR